MGYTMVYQYIPYIPPKLYLSIELYIFRQIHLGRLGAEKGFGQKCLGAWMLCKKWIEMCSQRNLDCKTMCFMMISGPLSRPHHDFTIRETVSVFEAVLVQDD